MLPAPTIVPLLLLLQQGPAGVNPVQPVRQYGEVLVAEEVFQATVADVVDGDSVVISDQSRSTPLLLDGIDAPEAGQRFGSDARAFLRALLHGKPVTVRRKGRGSGNGEDIARLEIDGLDASTALVRAGLAWRCPRYTDDRALAAVEREARDARRGLWQDASPVPPWRHRGAEECWQRGR